MHIVIANRWFPPENKWGGVGMYNYVIAHAYRELGHQVTVFASRTLRSTAAQQEVDGICIHRLLVQDHYRLRKLPVTRRYVRPMLELVYSWRLKQALRAWLDYNAVDVIEFAEVGAEGFFFARAPRAPFVVRCHTPTFLLRRYYNAHEMPYDTSLIGWCERDVIRRAHALTTPSSDLARIIAQACKIPLQNVTVLPNPLHHEDPPQGGEGENNGLVTILHVGRLERVKGIETLVQAIPTVLQSAPRVRFIFAGEDRRTGRNTSQREEMQSALARAGALSQVEFLGHIDQARLNECYQRADICVVPSMLYESFSYTCAQAMRAGRPVVATRIGGIPETVDDGVSGILVTPGDAKELAHALLRLVRDPALRARMGHAGRAKALVEFEATRVAKQNLTVYERAIANFADSQA